MLTTVTSASLLEGLKEPSNEVLWNAYVGRYRPLVVGYAVRMGLSREDAEDVAQETLLEFSTSYRAGRFDAERGRLRSWLFGIARNQIANWRRRNGKGGARAATQPATGVLESVPDDTDPDSAWEQEWRDAVLGQCLLEVRREVEPKTYEAFDLFALRALPAIDVANRCDMTPNAVFGCKRRVLARVRELLPLMEEIW